MINTIKTFKNNKRTSINENDKGKFFSDDNVKEKNRLIRQQKLLLNYDLEVYERLLDGKSSINVLDLGSGNGTALFNRLAKKSEISKIIGIEYDDKNVEHANREYGNNNIKFYQGDVESVHFEEKLSKIMQENKIDKFDFVNILALVSHLKNPSKLLKRIKPFCKKGGDIFIRNIDDGLTMAFPDDEGKFAKAVSLLQYCVSSGYRYSGRQLYTMLKTRGYKNIKLEKEAINTVGMSIEDREALYDTVFGFIKLGLENEIALNPKSSRLKKMHDWFLEQEDELEEKFMLDEFFFNFGFMIYTANY